MKKNPPGGILKQKIKTFQQMVGSDKRISSSYKKEMSSKADSIVPTLGSGSSVKPKDITKVIGDINKQRLSNVQKTKAYKDLSKNTSISETGVGKTVRHYEEKIKSGKNPWDYQIPKKDEIKRIIGFGESASSEKEIGKAIAKNPLKAAGAYFEMQKVRSSYPSMDSIAKKQIKRIK